MRSSYGNRSKSTRRTDVPYLLWRQAALQVIDVFESQAKLDAFGAKLMLILQDMGIEAKPTIFEIYNIIEGR